MEQRHQLAVSQLSRSLRSRYEQQVPFSSVGSISSESSGSLRKTSGVDGEAASSNKQQAPFASIIRIDPTRGICLVEPNVTFEHLVNATLKYNLIPRFVSRFPHTTAGTSFTTTSVESSSFKHGLFHHSVYSIEVVLQNGDVRRASLRENADLFHGMINTRSTLATLTLLEIRLMPTAPFVELSYLPVSSQREAVTLLNSVVHDDPFDYIDAILFSPTRGVVMVGRSTSNRNVYPVRRLLRPSDPFFHKHADSCLTKSLKSRENHTELIPLPDYLFRHAPGVFWLTALTSSDSSTTATLFSRTLADPNTRLRRAHDLLSTGGLAQRIICADLAVPLTTTSTTSPPAAEHLLAHIDTHLSVYPLWLCPTRDDSSAPFHAWTRTSSWPLQTRQMLLSIGVYGAPGPKTRLGIINNNSGSEYSAAFVAANRELEAKVRELGGQKWWTAPVFGSEEEFWAGLEAADGGGGREGYAGLRARCGAEGLDGLWEVCKVVEGVRVVRPRSSLAGGGAGMMVMSGRSSMSTLRTSSALAMREVGAPPVASRASVGLPSGRISRSASIRNVFKRESR